MGAVEFISYSFEISVGRKRKIGKEKKEGENLREKFEIMTEKSLR